MEVPSQAVRTLLELGMASVGSGAYKEALNIFMGLDAVRPGSEGPMIGMALMHMNMKAPDEAVKILREGVLSRHPDSLEAKMILAVALKVAGRTSECDTVVKELSGSGNAQAKRFADTFSAR